VTDFSMPGGGRRWLTEVRCTRPELPVIVVTALAADETGVRGLADAVLGKPVEADVLVDELRLRVATG